MSLDLTGLPPTPAEVEAFVNDPVAGGLREPGRPALGLEALGRAPRPPLARRGPLRRHARHPLRQLPRDVVVSRLGDRRLQPQPAVRPLHRRATRRRPVARAERRAARGHGLQPLQHHDERRGRDRRGIRRALRPRPHRDDGPRVARADGRLRGVPRPQVRSAYAERVLPDVGVLQQHHAGGDGRQHQRHAADVVPACGRRPRALARAGKGTGRRPAAGGRTEEGRIRRAATRGTTGGCPSSTGPIAKRPRASRRLRRGDGGEVARHRGPRDAGAAASRPKAYVLFRGEYDKRRDEVAAGHARMPAADAGRLAAEPARAWPSGCCGPSIR